ncbi:MAG: hypothetical protein ACHQ4H_10310 [Ktedonobacterales bacterium]
MKSLAFRTSGSDHPKRTQVSFSHVAPLLGTSLVIGAGGGFVLATVLTLSRALGIPEGGWWEATVQAHGHLQLYGWAGLFVLGVAFHFLPRLRGAPLAFPGLLPWFVALQIAALLLRSVSEPLAVVTGAGVWRAGLVASGVFEAVALGCALAIVAGTVRYGPPLATRPALWSVLPLLLCAFTSLGMAAVTNLDNTIRAAGSASSLVPPNGDALNVTLGLFGFLVPMALAMSARALPLYAGLDAFPRRPLWIAAWIYVAGLALACVGAAAGENAAALMGWGLAAMGTTLVYFVVAFVRLMRGRGHLPRRVAELAPQPEAVERAYVAQVARGRNAYGPFVALVASAYMWALLGGLLLLADGAALALGQTPPVAFDAARHALALGFIALLICGVAPRMLPGFSGGHIASPRLVTATLWLGNAAALLRVGSLLLAPPLAALGPAGTALDTALFGLSGPLGLALALCLLANLWPAIWPATRVFRHMPAHS